MSFIQTLLLHCTKLFAAGDPLNGQTVDLPHAKAGHSALASILQIVLGVAAALAVLMIVLGGLRFITAQGNPQDAAKARSTIVYALVGLLVAISAEAIVSFALSKIL